MLINWTKKEMAGGFVYETADIDGYNIYQNTELHDKFFVRCDGVDWEPIGPLDSFKDAEDIVMKIGITLTQYEEMLWKVLAAQALKVTPVVFDGTASMIEETAP